jgi:hypothetical protein
VTESVSDNEGERDGEEDGGEEDDDDSDDSSGGTEAPAKKAKIVLTEEEENFAKKFHPVVSKIDKEWKIPLRHVSDRS